MQSTLFDAIIHSKPTVKAEATLHFDGSCAPNPGPYSQCGFILCFGNRRTERSIFLGEGTCNTAEYHGIIAGMTEALNQGVRTLEIYGDSQLVIRGVSSMRAYRKGAPHLEALKAEAQSLARRFEHVEFHWVPREENAEADALSTAGIR